ncbi:16S rRNA (guanine(966)-N(2))-methyltransferase RsmD [Gammaproteobacteria bacterium]|nr:16S rRNA (guanine(966)-N(2))-methyltransferase RsmD [Gammaproteobacteria bacterium]
MANTLYIDGGIYHKRKIKFANDLALKPTASRVRTTLFDWIRLELKGCRCLDLFAGSGILSFQALSWGADSSYCVDQNPEACVLIAEQAKNIGANIEVKTQSLPNKLEGQYDMCFIDPPFSEQKLLDKVLRSITKQGILMENALVYVEWGDRLILSDWKILKYKKVGQVYLHLLEQL